MLFMFEINLKNNFVVLIGFIFKNDKLCDNLVIWYL